MSRWPRRAGLEPDDIARVVDDVAVPGWGPRQRLLLGAVDELHDHRVITDLTWRALASELTDRQLIELCMLVGHYEMLAMTLNSLGVEPERTALARLGGATAEAAEQLRERLLSARRGVTSSRVVTHATARPRRSALPPPTREGSSGRHADRRAPRPRARRPGRPCGPEARRMNR